MAGLLPPDDELPREVKEEEHDQESIITDLFLEEAGIQDISGILTKSANTSEYQSYSRLVSLPLP